MYLCLVIHFYLEIYFVEMFSEDPSRFVNLLFIFYCFVVPLVVVHFTDMHLYILGDIFLLKDVFCKNVYRGFNSFVCYLVSFFSTIDGCSLVISVNIK